MLRRRDYEPRVDAMIRDEPAESLPTTFSATDGKVNYLREITR